MGKKQKKKDNGVAGLFLLFGWLLFILLALIFYFYFWEDIPFLPGHSGYDSQVSGEVLNPKGQYETKYIYQTNANVEINALVSDYMTGLTTCDQAKLKGLVTEPSAFDDMTLYQSRAEIITGYSNINCYTLPGYTEDAVLVYVISNMHIAGVTSTPLNMQQYYIREAGDEYKIDNGALDEATLAYIAGQNENADILELGKSVQDNINQCLERDADFAEFYNKLYALEQ